MFFAFNRSANYGHRVHPSLEKVLGFEGLEEVRALLNLCPVYEPTVIRTLSAKARELGIADLAVKDESTRLGLDSFKALGGAHAVIRLLLRVASERLGRPVEAKELFSEEVAAVAATLTVGCATDGNHGRSVAAGARRLGMAAKIFVHAGVSATRCQAMAELGAQIVQVPGSYDDSVRVALEACEQHGWHMVSDTSWSGYEETPLLVMQGYIVIMYEALTQLDEPPTHVFLQAGVGGFAAACAIFLKVSLGADCPKLVVVEPSTAACIYESINADRLVKLSHNQSTVMAMLECYEPSLIAWEVLSRLADFFMTINEEEAVGAMRELALPLPGDPAIVAGESGGVGFGALRRAIRLTDIAACIGLDGHSRVLLINTEGATDPAIYTELTGLDPANVARSNLNV